MSIQQQKTYTCKCGKKREYPKYSQFLRCGCGREHKFKDGKVTITDKKTS